MEPKSENNKEVIATTEKQQQSEQQMEGTNEEGQDVKDDHDGVGAGVGVGNEEEGDNDEQLSGHNNNNNTQQDESNPPENNTSLPPPPEEENEDTKEPEEEFDDEGLRKDGYDVILCGTGLIQSILGSALTRVGKRVLHCDNNDFYGELDSVLSLGDFERLVDRFRGITEKKNDGEEEEEGMDDGTKGEVPSGNNNDDDDDAATNNERKQPITHSGIPLHSKGGFSSFRTHSVTTIDPNKEDVAQWSVIDVGTRVVTPYGQGTVLSLPKDANKTTTASMDNSMEGTNEQNTNSLVVRLHSWTLANGTYPTAYFGVPSYRNIDTTTNTTNNNNNDWYYKRMITTYCDHQHSVRPFSTILYESLIHNQKRSYAIDLTPGLIYANGTAVDGMVDSGVSEYCEFKSLLGLYLSSSSSSSSGGNGNGNGSTSSSTSTTNKGNFGRVGFANWSKKITHTSVVMDGGSSSSSTRRSSNRSSPTSTSPSPVVSSNVSPSSSSSTTTTHCVLSKVPCCKSDVFQTKLLSPVDKRRLMKFLQLASDYATATAAATAVDTSKKKLSMDGTNHNDGDDSTNPNNDASSSSSLTGSTTNNTSTTTNTIDGVVQEETVSSLNERQLRQGRSLYRPQNKTVTATSDLEILQSCIQQNMGFDTYLETKHRLGKRLRSIVVHAMAMGSSSSSSSSGGVVDGDGAAVGMTSDQTYSAQDGMNDLCRHLQSLGRFGATAFLVPLYGTGELSQAFCRSAAVHGGTYLLRRGAKQVLFEEKVKGDDEGDDEKNGGCGAAKVCGIVLGANREEEEGVEEGYSRICRVDKAIYAKNVVVSADALLVEDGTETDKVATGMMDYLIPKRGRRTLRRISILRGQLIPTNEGGGWERRSDDIETREQRHIIVFPPGTVGNSHVVRGIVVDESVHVAPRNNYGDDGCCLLHLTTTIDEEEDDVDGDRRRVADNSDDNGDVLERAVRTLLRNPDGYGNSDGGGVEELYHATFSYQDHSSYAYTTAFTTPIPLGLHVCARRGVSVTVDEAFTEARSIFEAICPDHDFLRLSEVMEDIVNEAKVGRTDEEDHDVMLLESAMDMVDSKLVANGEVEEIRNGPLV